MTKIVYNACYGGFSLSDAAIERYAELKGEAPLKEDKWYEYRHNIPRHDPLLAQVVEELADASWGPFAELAICELPSGTKYRVDEYDGYECVMPIDSYRWFIA